MRYLFLSSFLAYLLTGFPAFASSLTTTQNLSFGTLIPLAPSGSVGVSFGGVMTTNSVVSIAPTGTAYSNGIMKYQAAGLSGLLDIQFMPQSSASSVTLANSTSGGGTVTINNFTYTPNLTVSLLSPTRNFSVGGTMTFNSSSQYGIYTGFVQIFVPSLLGGLIPAAPAASLPITLTFWRPLSATQQASLNFGSMAVIAPTPTVVRISSGTGIRTIVSGSGVNLLASSPTPTPQAGRFSVTGQPNTPISITLPSSAVISSASSSMNVTNFTKSPSTTTLTLDASGNAIFYVGADLTVNSMQASGSYSGTYNITINY